MRIILFVYAFVLVDILLVMPLSRVGRKKEEEKERPPTRSGRLCAALYCMSPPPLVSNARLRLKGIPRLEKVCVEVVVKYTGMSFLSFMLHSCGYCCCQVLNHVQGSTGSLANKTLFGGGMG